MTPISSWPLSKCSTPTQRSLLGQDSPYIVGPPIAKIQAPAPPVGLVEVRTSPSVALILRAATQKPMPGHVTAMSGLEPSRRLTFQAAAPPVGLVEVITFPARSPATQRLLVAHDTAARGLEPYTV